ncbi:heavy metal-binding domain-containing protein [Flavobacterium humi]|uniref:Heavy metal binding domain-containing protein n=1 Tax=Flavobacterium humi TaxID=2562683 RepID=A0A4Z0LDD6_9FLAO|nr:heavy metal-binding domain-containing protein [Flavobacterium humi]TGD59874.1 hypothetical protein E4635_02790 [Flavobacterium humi]
METPVFRAIIRSEDFKNKYPALGKILEANEPEKWYTCPMHPEIRGKFNDKCPQCGMPLTLSAPLL